MAQKMLQQSLEAEHEIANKLSPGEHDISSDFSRLGIHRKVSRDESDDSEASSVCSERSFDSYRRQESFSWNGSRNRLDSSRVLIEDIETIIHYCGSGHWSERKDGLISLTEFLSTGRVLNLDELNRILELFRKMFMDPHVKVYGLFLDALNEVISVHSNDMHNYLFTILSKLFTKLGSDLLGSMTAKVWKTLDLCHEYFPGDDQMSCVFKILSDNIVTPNLKTKLATIKFLTSLASKYCKPTDFVTAAPADRAILKLVQYCLDSKSVEFRSNSRLCMIALYNLNATSVSLIAILAIMGGADDVFIFFLQMTMILSQLPKQYQDNARQFIAAHLRRSTSGEHKGLLNFSF